MKKLDNMPQRGKSTDGRINLQKLKKAAGRPELKSAILSQIRDAVVGLDNSYRIIYWNAAAERLYGIKAEDALGYNCLELVGNQWLEPIDELDFTQSLDKNGYWYGEAIQTLKRGESIFVELSISTMKDRRGHGNGYLALVREISSRKKAEKEKQMLLSQVSERQEAFKVSEAKYKALFESLPLGVTISDRDGNVVETNKEGERLLGTSRDDQVKRKIDGREWQVIRPDGSPMPADEFASVKALKENCVVENVEMGIVKGEDDITWINVNAAPIPLENYGLAITYTDISRRKQVENALQKAYDEMEMRTNELKVSEQSYRSLFNGMTEGFALHEIVCDENDKPCDYRFLEINPSFERLTGLRRENVVGRLLSEVLPDDDPAWVEKYGQVALTGNSIHFENRSIALNRDYEIFAYSPAPRQFAVLFIDITDRKEAEARLAHLASFPERNPMPIVEMNVSGDIGYINPAARQIFPNLLQSGNRHPLLEGWETLVVEFRQTNAHDITREIKIGEQWYGQTVANELSNQRIRFYCKDITERKKLDQLKDDFIGMVSHEMRTPLTVIIGALSTLHQHGERLAKKERQQLLGDAIIEADVLSHILDNLLELSRSHADRLKMAYNKVALVDIAQKVVKKFERKSDHQVVLEFDEDIPLIEADPLRVERVIFNLVQNAVKYSPGGGPVKLCASRQDGNVLVKVEDCGRGISPADQARLFNPFQRVEEERNSQERGVGLGLVVCKSLVEAHGGRIWLESEQGKGTSVYFTLPLKSGSK